MKDMHLCYGCMEKTILIDGSCHKCGFNEKNYMQRRAPKALAPGQTIREGRYLIGKTLGIGGFGITYIGYDTLLRKKVAIKEYFPAATSSRNTMYATHETNRVYINDAEEEYKKGLEDFLIEAKTVARFNKIKGIATVTDFLRENNTAYMIMEYLPGKSVKKIVMERENPFSQDEVLSCLKPIMEALKIVHKSNIVHRDISPENLVMDDKNELTLVDFGSARKRSTSSRHYTILLKNGYAPIEQYNSSGNQGPWTDVYSLCATIYYMMTGKVPPLATERYVNDTLCSLMDLGIKVSRTFSDAIMMGLAVDYRKRIDSIENLEQLLYHANEEIFEDDKTVLIDDNTVVLDNDDTVELDRNNVMESEDDITLEIATDNILKLDDDKDRSDFKEKINKPIEHKKYYFFAGIAVIICFGIAFMLLRKSNQNKEDQLEILKAVSEIVISSQSEIENIPSEEATSEPEIEHSNSIVAQEMSAVDKAKKYQEYFVNGMEPLEYNGHAYAIIDYEDIPGLNKIIPSFEEWEELANYMEGYLAVIEGENENEFIYDEVLGSQGFTGAFFGYTDRDNEGEWNWVNGSTSTYTNWNQREDASKEIYVQPNNGSSSQNKIEENYAEFYRATADGTWNDARPGENTHKFVVEWE